MNCSEFQNWLQQCLDGETIADAVDIEGHLASCSSCRELRTAAGRFVQVLKAQIGPAPPDRMRDQLVSLALEEIARQQQAHKRWNRRLGITAALAAGLLLAVLLGRSWWQTNVNVKPVPSPESVVAKEEKSTPVEGHPSLNIQEAGSALVALVNRTADETVGQSRVLLPQGVSAPTLPASEDWQPALEPGAESLREAQEGVALGFEPVTSSARRAVNLFLREIPPMETQKQ
jgi:hypothetical protein